MAGTGNSLRALVIGATLIVALCTVLFFISLLVGDATPTLPTRAEAESAIVAKVAASERVVVTATCEEPKGTAYRCMLRDPKGRYGYSQTTFDKQPAIPDGATTYGERTTWEFPFGSDGTLTKDFELSPGGDLSYSVTYYVRLAAQAVTLEPFRTGATCPEPAVGQAVTCAATGLLRSATLHRSAAYQYRIDLAFTLPPGR